MTFSLIPNRNLTVVTSDHKVLTITKDNPNWAAILECVKHNDEAGVIRLMSIPKTVESFGSTIPTRGNIEVRGREVFYRNEKLYGEDVSRIFDYIDQGFPVDSMILFLEKKLKNPSKRSIDSLYSFLDNKGMPITDAGTFLGYKGVRADFNSINIGDEPLISGIRNSDGSISNAIGQSPRMERRFVNDDFANACSGGLHVGSLEYALGWAGAEGRVVIVSVDPADVVTVPTQETCKLRVCGYTVVGEYTQKLPDTYSGDYARPEDTEPVDFYDESEDSEFPSDTCNECVKCGGCETCKTCDCGTEIIPIHPKTGDWSLGYSIGKKHGIGHVKRMYYEVDRGSNKLKKTSQEFLNGYLHGYRENRTK